jgi:hypothetical protein
MHCPRNLRRWLPYIAATFMLINLALAYERQKDVETILHKLDQLLQPQSPETH